MYVYKVILQIRTQTRIRWHLQWQPPWQPSLRSANPWPLHTSEDYTSNDTLCDSPPPPATNPQNLQLEVRTPIAKAIWGKKNVKKSRTICVFFRVIYIIVHQPPLLKIRYWFQHSIFRWTNLRNLALNCLLPIILLQINCMEMHVLEIFVYSAKSCPKKWTESNEMIKSHETMIYKP